MAALRTCEREAKGRVVTVRLDILCKTVTE
jgi:hypothetical protein